MTKRKPRKPGQLLKDLARVEKKVSDLEEKKRLEWLQHVCREARDAYSFGSLGELIAFIFDHALDIQLKSGDIEEIEGS